MINHSKYAIRFCKGALVLLALRLGPFVAFILRVFIFRDAVAHFKGKKVFCTGAAPTAKPPNIKYDRYVAISHASKLLVEVFDVKCDLNIMGGLNKERKYANEVHQLLVTGTRDNRKKISYTSYIKYKNFFSVHNWMRAFIVNYICRTNYLDNIPSHRFTSVGSSSWALTFLIFLGAKSIHMTGINLRTGTDSQFTNYYDKINNKVSYNQSRVRNHASSDLNVFASVALIYRDKIKITTDELELEAAFFPNTS